MKVCSVITAVASAILLIAPVHAQQDNIKHVRFTVGEASFEMPAPEGYCIPQREEVALSKEVAAADSQNRTLAEFHRCGSPFGTDYILVKSAYATESLTFDKASFLDQFTQFFQSQMGQSAQDQGLSIAKRDVEKSTNGGMTLEDSPYGYSRTDDECVYISGTINMQAIGAKVEVPVGSCISVVGSKQIAVHSYGEAENGREASQLEQQSRDVALMISAL